LLAFERQGTAKVRVEIVANDSRQLALLYGRGAGQLQIAEANGRNAKTQSDAPTIRPAPRIKVTAQPLPDVSQSASSPQGQPAKPGQTQSALALPAREVEPKVDGHITQEPVSRTRMYIQVGAFAQYVNAHRLKARLSVLGPTNVLAVMFKEQQMFRVRIGPIHDLKAADHMLSRVIGAGYTSARLIVDR
jgi:rare lipoprotein A